MAEGTSKHDYGAWSHCSDCEHEMRIGYFHQIPEHEMTFLGMRGMETITFCPFCGRKNAGFAPFDGEMEQLLQREKAQARMMRQLYGDDDEDDDDDDEYDEDDECDDDEFEDDDDEDDGKQVVMDPTPEPGASLFRCKECGEEFRIKADKAFCYFCGNEDTEKVEENEQLER